MSGFLQILRVKEDEPNICLKEFLVPKLRENGEVKEWSVVAGVVKSLCATMEGDGDGAGRELKAALEMEGHQTHALLRKWALSALKTYDSTFPGTDPLQWGLLEGSCQWEDYEL